VKNLHHLHMILQRHHQHQVYAHPLQEVLEEHHESFEYALSLTVLLFSISCRTSLKLKKLCVREVGASAFCLCNKLEYVITIWGFTPRTSAPVRSAPSFFKFHSQSFALPMLAITIHLVEAMKGGTLAVH
jgi:hypothetical protein